MNWERFKRYYFPFPELGFALDISRMAFPDEFIEAMAPRMKAALESMEKLEGGAVANPDENRMVGHYWLRCSALAPDKAIQEEIENTRRKIIQFADDVHAGRVSGSSGRFKNLLVIGIGGSALGPQFVSHALGHPRQDKMHCFFLDNTDPDGMDLVFSQLEGKLGETLVVVVSKSGSTSETRNGMLETEHAYRSSNLNFGRHAVAITGEGSKLDNYATGNTWLKRFPMWDWVGGRTSETSLVGLLPAALQGIDTKALLQGAAAMDILTRRSETEKNPAALLALMWYYATDGAGKKDMVIIPYKDRLTLFSKYLQQLIMESLGKERDLEGQTVHQGISVYGNKGSTDQHAYIQQLRNGIHNFFVTFIEVLTDRDHPSIEVEPDITAGDYLQGFLLGTRAALSEKDRQSITLTIEKVTPFSIGLLIALYERAVGLYADLIGINAYHQPGVEAGKKAAANFLQLKQRILKTLRETPGKAYTPETLARELKLETQTEFIFKLLEHLAANPQKGIQKEYTESFLKAQYSYLP